MENNIPNRIFCPLLVISRRDSSQAIMCDEGTVQDLEYEGRNFRRRICIFWQVEDQCCAVARFFNNPHH